ncbi:MAG: hypothetical protein KF841_04045 [Phycisphaerae bacterium]|nr:hypothetical protein [Phycisphaerae bacterium]
MNIDGHDNPASLLDGYVDHQLSEVDRARFEQAIAADESLRAAVELQRKINGSLRRLYAPTPGDAPSEPVGSTDDTALGAMRSFGESSRARQPRRFTRGGLAAAVAASIVAALALGWYGWHAFFRMPSSTFLAEGPRLIDMAEAYQICVANKFKAQWLCKDDREFAQTFFWKFGSALAIVAPPPNAEWTGVSYVKVAGAPSSQCVEILAKVDGRGVVVFVDRDFDLTIAPALADGLYMHRRRLPNLSLVEVSPFEQPAVLDLIHERDMPEEWKQPPAYFKSNAPAGG